LTLGVWSVVGAPWAGAWFYRWFAERIVLPGGRGLRLEADVRGAWPLFVTMGLANWLEDGLGAWLDHKSALAVSVLIEVALWAWLVKWFVTRLGRTNERRASVSKGPSSASPPGSSCSTSASFR
jgi:hypothetical protein